MAQVDEEYPDLEYIIVLNYLYPEIQAAAAGSNYEDIIWYDETQIIPKETLRAGYLEMRKRMLAEEATVEMNRRIDEGVVYLGRPFATDINSRVNLSGAILGITALGRTVPPGFTWRSSDDVSVPMTQEELLGFGALVVDYTFALHHALWAKKEQIFDPTVDTLAALEALDVINSGWPPKDMVMPTGETPTEPPAEPTEPPPDTDPDSPPAEEPADGTDPNNPTA